MSVLSEATGALLSDTSRAFGPQASSAIEEALNGLDAATEATPELNEAVRDARARIARKLRRDEMTEYGSALAAAREFAQALDTIRGVFLLGHLEDGGRSSVAGNDFPVRELE